MSVVTWEDPPESGRTKALRDWDAVAEALRARPGAWAVVAEDVSLSLATAMRKGRNKAFPEGDYEFRTAGAKNGRAAKLYARYVGGVTA